MKTRPWVLKLSLGGVILSLFALQAGTVRCEPPSKVPAKARTQTMKEPARKTQSYDQDQNDEKIQRYHELEYLIQKSLMIQYGRLDAIRDLKDRLD